MLRHLGPHPVMSIKPYPVGFAVSWRLAHVMEKRGNRKLIRIAAVCVPIKHVHNKAGMLKHISFGMKLRRLLHSMHTFDFGEKMLKKTGSAQKPESVSGISAGKYLNEFLAYSFPAYD